jgi:hypothetical protein
VQSERRASVADRSDQRCRRHRADPFDVAKTLADLAVAIELSEALSEQILGLSQLC